MNSIFLFDRNLILAIWVLVVPIVPITSIASISTDDLLANYVKPSMSNCLYKLLFHFYAIPHANYLVISRAVCKLSIVTSLQTATQKFVFMEISTNKKKKPTGKTISNLIPSNSIFFSNRNVLFSEHRLHLHRKKRNLFFFLFPFDFPLKKK